MFTSIFDTSQAQNVKGARKALAILARKISLMAKKDLMNNISCSNSSIDHVINNKKIVSVNKSKSETNVNSNTDLLEQDETAKLRVQFERLLTEGKVQVNDEQALPVP